MFTLRRSRSWAVRSFSLVLCASLCIALSTGCFGYNRSAKRTAYFGDTILILGGGATVAAELTLGGNESCEGPGCPEDMGPITGPLIAGTILITAGIVGILLNITRPIVKTSR